jgi:hypothetical protein
MASGCVRNPSFFRRNEIVAALLAGLAGILLAGCGMAASPQPPSLQLPQPVQDLSAIRSGNKVHLHWTAPEETIDKLTIRRPVTMTVCRQNSAGVCEKIASVIGQPGKPVEYMDALPAALTASALRPLSYQVSALSPAGRNAGLSNSAAVLAGATLPPVQQFTATLTEKGVLLHWQKAADLPPDTFLELHRTLLTPQTAHAALPGLPAQTEPAEQTLKIAIAPNAVDPGMALDPSAMPDRKYQYIAQRVAAQLHGTETILSRSLPSTAVVMDTHDIFPPAAPVGLAAVPVPADMNNGLAEVDLSWSANTDADFAQYIVYRRDADTSVGTMSQISSSAPNQAVIAPTFRDLNVHPGQTYIYEVVAVDRDGNRSRPSTQITVTVPGS